MYKLNYCKDWQTAFFRRLNLFWGITNEGKLQLADIRKPGFWKPGWNFIQSGNSLSSSYCFNRANFGTWSAISADISVNFI